VAKTTYLDFDLLVEGPEATYRARVLSSPAGDASAICPIDPTAEDLRAFLHRLNAGDTDETFLVNLGCRLFNGLFADDIASIFRASLGQARGQGKGLRIRLRLEPPELVTLPWEYLYDAQEDCFIAISPETPLVRYVPMHHAPRPTAVSPPLRVLVVISNPTDFVPLDVNQERGIIQQALQDWLSQELIQLHVLEHAAVAEISQAMRTFRPHIFHFIGHGQYRGETAYVMLEDDQGFARPMGERIFRDFFLGIPEARLAVLNACQTATASSAQSLRGLSPRILQRNLSAVVAMQFPIPEEAALIFSREFYRSLALGYPVDAAIAEARRGIFLDVGGSARDWGTPVLYMRSLDGRIFDVERVTDKEQQEYRHHRKIVERLSRPDNAEQLPLRTAMILGSVLGFLVGVLGNLVAGWIQQDLLGNAFTLPWIAVVLLLTTAGLGAGAWLQRPQILDRKPKALIVTAFVLAVLIAIVSSLTNGIGANGTNHPPDIHSVLASPSTLRVGQNATLTVIATDTDGDNLVYYWEAKKGTVPSGAQGDTITYTAPTSSGLDTITVTVTDGDVTVSQEKTLSVLASDASGQ